MPCKPVQHMVEKADPGVDLRRSRSVQIQADPNLRLFRISNYLGSPMFHRTLAPFSFIS